MNRFNTTIDDNSPFITYSPVEAWTYGQASSDAYFEGYANGTFTLTDTVGATATFTFYGTGVWIWGARRPNHGMYTVTVDGSKSGPISGRRSDGIGEVDDLGNQFNSLLYRAFDLDLGIHDVVLTNEGSQGSAEAATYVDIDYITWETQVGLENSTVTTSTLDSNNFLLSGSGWRSTAENEELGTRSGLYTTVPGDALELSFEVSTVIRDAVEVHGSTGQACGLFSVQIDGGIQNTYNASTHKNFINQLLFYGADLSPGLHTLRMTNSELSNGTLVVDHARVQRALPDGSTSSQSTVDGGSSSNKALIGGLCGGLAFLMILVLGLFLWMRRRRRVAIISRKTDPARFERFDIDQPALPAQVSARQSLLSDLLRGSMMSRGTRSDVSKTSNRTDGTESRSHSPKNLTPVPFILEKPKPERMDVMGRNLNANMSMNIIAYSNPRSILRAPSPMVVPNSDLSYDLISGEASASTSRLPYDVPGTGTGMSSSMGTSATPITNRRKPHGGRKRERERDPRKKPSKKRRPLPIIPGARPGPSSSSGEGEVLSIFRLQSSFAPTRSRSRSRSRTTSTPSSSQQPYRSTSTMKGRRRSIRNSRIVRAGYNFFFANPGSSNSGSAYAPTTVLTSTISERPTATLSPVTEAPPPLPPSRSQSPVPRRPLHLVNQVDEY